MYYVTVLLQFGTMVTNLHCFKCILRKCLLMLFLFCCISFLRNSSCCRSFQSNLRCHLTPFKNAQKLLPKLSLVTPSPVGHVTPQFVELTEKLIT